MSSSWFRLALWATIHVALSVIGFLADAWYVWIVVWAVQAFNLLTLVAVVHECSHRHFVGPKVANDVIGFAAAGVGLACFESYRAQHMTHHADACGEDDAEGEPYKFTARWQIVVAFGGGGFLYALSLFVTGVGVALGTSPAWLKRDRQRRRIRTNIVVLLAAYGSVAVLVAAGGVSFQTVAFVWLVPVVASLLGPVPYVLIPEHYDAPGPGSPFENTRTCVSNPVLRFVFLNTNLHTAHHHKGSLPWQGLVEHHRTIEDQMHDEWLFPSYAAFHRFMWRTTGRPAAHQAPSPV